MPEERGVGRRILAGATLTWVADNVGTDRQCGASDRRDTDDVDLGAAPTTGRHGVVRPGQRSTGGRRGWVGSSEVR
jgi:hypothetical protein